MNADLELRLLTIAETPVLLVTSDFDGTLSPLIDDPAAATPCATCMAALAELAELDHTHAAILSGRGRSDLVHRTNSPRGVRIVGSHGAEPDDGDADLAPPGLLDRLLQTIEAIAASGTGLLVERKPLGVALHYRTAAPPVAEAAVSAATIRMAGTPGVHVRHGSMVVEFSVSPTDKGAALARLRHAVGATAVLFIGDDRTDEDALRTLGPCDVGIKVGDDDTVASHRVPDVDGVVGVLARLVELRRKWLATRRLVPLEALSLLSDERTVAVLDPRGSLVWHCLPRIDSSAAFSGILSGSAAGGWFETEALGDVDRPTQRYEPGSFVLVTDWGGIRVVDYMDCSNGRPYQRAGRSDLLRVIEGRGRVRVRFAPRLDFGRVATTLSVRGEGLHVDGAADPLVLRSPGVMWTIRDDGMHQSAEAMIELTGEPVVLELRSGSANVGESTVAEATRRAQTVRFWRGWVDTLVVPPIHSEVVRRSALVLKALCHGPSGAIAAAATTSLPEHLGGERNWDYRFCWPRDAAMAAAALVRVGNTGHALRLLDWLLAVVDDCETPERLRPIYTVTGRHLGPEAEIGTLAGYGGSRPVRISNAAANQVQLDVFGPIVDLVALLADRGAPVSPDHWRLVRAMVHAIESRWREPDHGVWEIRADRRHHVHSKVMCWLTVDRALRVQEHIYGQRDSDWEALAAEIREEVIERGWSSALGAFTAAYGSRTLDAATLMVGLTGLVQADDPRFVATVEQIDRVLRRGGVVYRYLEPDGLAGREGGMLVCAGWLVESLHLIGRHDDARALLDELVALVGPTGIAPEQYCPRYRIALGNIAQAYSHLAIINAAVALSPR